MKSGLPEYLCSKWQVPESQQVSRMSRTHESDCYMLGKKRKIQLVFLLSLVGKREVSYRDRIFACLTFACGTSACSFTLWPNACWTKACCDHCLRSHLLAVFFACEQYACGCYLLVAAHVKVTQTSKLYLLQTVKN